MRGSDKPRVAGRSTPALTQLPERGKEAGSAPQPPPHRALALATRRGLRSAAAPLRASPGYRSNQGRLLPRRRRREAWPPLLAPPRARAEGARLEPEPSQPVVSRPEHDLAVVGVLPPFRLSRTSVPAGSLHGGKRHQSRSEARTGRGEQCSRQHLSRAINHPTRYNCACFSQF